MIRPAIHSDLRRILELSVMHAELENSPLPEIEDDNRIARERALGKLILGQPPAMTCLVVQVEQSLEGYATYGTQFSTWRAGAYVYLDCLFLTDRIRGKGMGWALMEHIRLEAKAMGVAEIQWQTPASNLDAIRFYERLGAVSLSKQRFFWKVHHNDG